MVHCMSTTFTTHVIVSYSSGFFGLGDQFNCVCGHHGVLRKAKQVENAECDQPCPGDGLQCGQAARDLVSVYCMLVYCTDASTLSPADICQYSHPHQVQGCVVPHHVNWDQVVNIRDFIGDTRQGCVWRCKDMEGGGVALTRCCNYNQYHQISPQHVQTYQLPPHL